MSYRNPMHGLDSDGARDLSVRGATLPAVTADHTSGDDWTGPRHRDGEPDRGYADNDLHAQAEDSATEIGRVEIDMWEVNQRELERRVAAGEPLPEMADGTPVTPQMVIDWRVERGHREVATAPPGVQVVQTATGLSLGIPVTYEIDAEPIEPDARCVATCGVPATDRDHAGAGCRVHPDGAHRCYRRPRHQDGQTDETGGRLHDADHQCDCGAIWLNLVGGMREMDRLLSGRHE